MYICILDRISLDDHPAAARDLSGRGTADSLDLALARGTLRKVYGPDGEPVPIEAIGGGRSGGCSGEGRAGARDACSCIRGKWQRGRKESAKAEAQKRTARTGL